MSLINGFDADQIKGDEAIPDGTQATCVAIEAEDVATKDGNGAYIKFTIEVVEGQYKGQRVWPMFNVKNQNEKAVQIAMQQLKQFCLAVGCPRPSGNNDLLNKPFRATFGKPSDFNGQQQSRIKKFDPVGGTAGVTAAFAQPAANQAPANKPAWAK